MLRIATKLAVLLMCIAGWNIPVLATSYDPTFNNPHMIVVSVTAYGDSKALRSKLNTAELRKSLVAYLVAQLKAEGIDTPVVEAGYQEVPEGILPHNITNVTVRLDIGRLTLNDGGSAIIGSVAVFAVRDQHVFVSNKLVTFFSSVSEEEIANDAIKAAYAQVQTSVVDPIVFLAK